MRGLFWLARTLLDTDDSVKYLVGSVNKLVGSVNKTQLFGVLSPVAAVLKRNPLARPLTSLYLASRLPWRIVSTLSAQMTLATSVHVHCYGKRLASTTGIPKVASNLFDLSGRTALITGASRGLGQSFARALAKAGADLVVTGRRAGDLVSFCNEIQESGRKALPLELDVRDQSSVESMCTAAIDACGTIDILVNNAGCNIRKPALEVTWDDWNTILDTNLRGMFFVTQGIGRQMVDRGYGRIVNIGSYTSVAGFAHLAPYGASRGGVKQLTMSLADDWGPHGVTVNCLAPGWFKTDLTRVLFESPGWSDYLNDRIPVKRPGEPEDLDAAIVFLASEASRYVTGQTLLVDGGLSTGAVRVPLNSTVTIRG